MALSSPSSSSSAASDGARSSGSKSSGSGSCWLTYKRLRAHAIILAVCLWSLYMWNLTTPGLRDRYGNLKGTDFLHFYILGSLANAHRGDLLYDMTAQAMLAAQRVPQSTGIRYLPLYPPQVSLFFGPLARLPYWWALALWWACSAVIYGVCCYCVWRACPELHPYGRLVTLLAIAFPAFFHLIAWGQISALALACFTLAFFLLRARREFAAGLVLGCLIFKPQLGLAAAVVFVFLGAWKTVIGAALSATAQLAVGVLYYGMQPFYRWLGVMWHLRNMQPLLEPRPYQTHSLRTFWSLLIPQTNFGSHVAFALYAITAATVLALTISVWKQNESWALRYASLLLATVLVAPHLTVYDLVILAPAFLVLADWLITEGLTAQPDGALSRSPAAGLGTLLYLVYMLPLLGPLAYWTYLQLSVVAMTAALYVLWSIDNRITNQTGT